MKLWTNTDFDGLVTSLSSEDKMLRHDIRYACFRIQKEKEDGTKAEEKHHKIGNQVEKIDGFGGWNNFAITWDISTPNPIAIVSRKWSIYEEWNQTLMRITVPLPIVKVEKG